MSQAAFIPGTKVIAKTIVMPPKISAVYFLLKNRQVVYVGQSGNLIARIWTHRVEAVKDFDEVVYVDCEPSDLDACEAHWIIKLNPPLNAQPERSHAKLKRSGPVRNWSCV